LLAEYASYRNIDVSLNLERESPFSRRFIQQLAGNVNKLDGLVSPDHPPFKGLPSPLNEDAFHQNIRGNI
jgi:hypothetical protein